MSCVVTMFKYSRQFFFFKNRNGIFKVQKGFENIVELPMGGESLTYSRFPDDEEADTPMKRFSREILEYID